MPPLTLPKFYHYIPFLQNLPPYFFSLYKSFYIIQVATNRHNKISLLRSSWEEENCGTERATRFYHYQKHLT